MTYNTIGEVRTVGVRAPIKGLWPKEIGAILSGIVSPFSTQGLHAVSLGLVSIKYKKPYWTVFWKKVFDYGEYIFSQKILTFHSWEIYTENSSV